MRLPKLEPANLLKRLSRKQRSPEHLRTLHAAGCICEPLPFTHRSGRTNPLVWRLRSLFHWWRNQNWIHFSGNCQRCAAQCCQWQHSSHVRDFSTKWVFIQHDFLREPD